MAGEIHVEGFEDGGDLRLDRYSSLWFEVSSTIPFNGAWKLCPMLWVENRQGNTPPDMPGHMPAGSPHVGDCPSLDAIFYDTEQHSRHDEYQ